MGDRPASMLTEAAQAKIDAYVATPAAAIAYFKAVPWPEIAACLACFWWALRLAGLARKWWRNRKP